MSIKINKYKFEKAIGTFITDYINYSLAKSGAPNMYIVGRVGLGNRHKTQVFMPICYSCVKKNTIIANAYKSILYNFYLIRFVVRSIIHKK